MAAATVGVVSEPMGSPASQQACHAPALQLLLRFLPFKSGGRASTVKQPQLQDTRHLLLEELHKHPLWRWSSLDEYRPSLQAAWKNAIPQESDNALLDYVRMAAEEEQQQRPRRAHQYRRSQQLTSAEAAAELQALYALAVVHVASQQHSTQQRKGSDVKQSCKQLSDSDFGDLLKAYVALNEAGNNSNSSSSSSSSSKQPHEQHSQRSTATAAVQALYAFAQLADSVQQQQQPRAEAPGQLQACRRVCEAAGTMCGTHTSKQPVNVSNAWQSQGAEQDLQVLLKLAQLGAQA